jgi:hypothetical protein
MANIFGLFIYNTVSKLIAGVGRLGQKINTAAHVASQKNALESTHTKCAAVLGIRASMLLWKGPVEKVVVEKSHRRRDKEAENSY